MGKKSTPAPPDYAAAARETAEGNEKNLASQTLANRANTFTPWGSLVWDREVTKNPLTGEDEITWSQYEDVAPELQQALQNEFGISNARTGIAGGLLGRIADSYGGEFDMSGLPEVESIDPSKFDPWSRLDMTGMGGYGDLNTEGLADLPDSGFGAVESVRDAMMSRLNPDIQQARDSEVQRLKAQGITEGSLAFDKAMQRMDRAKTDAEQQALLGAAGEYGNIFNRGLAARQQGFGERSDIANFLNQTRGQQFGERTTMSNMANALRQAQSAEASNLMSASGAERTRAIQEQAFLRNLPLNELNALLGGGQVQNPQFENYNTAGYVGGPDMLGAAQQQYQAALGSANAKNAGTAGLTSGLFGLAGSALGGPAGGFMGGLLGKAISGGK